MSKAKLVAARELIKEKRYTEARSILEGVDHPTAEKWLAKLDEIAPVQTRNTKQLKIAGLGLLALLVIGIPLIFLLTSNSSVSGNDETNNPFIGKWVNQYRVGVMFREDGTGEDGLGSFDYEIISHDGDVYLIRNTTTEQSSYVYGSEGIEEWVVVSDEEIHNTRSMSGEFFDRGVTFEEWAELERGEPQVFEYTLVSRNTD